MNQTNNDDEWGFDPHELESIAQRMDEIFIGEDEGYEMIFYISQNDADELVEAYRKARTGDPKALARCYLEITKILEALEKAVESDDK